LTLVLHERGEKEGNPGGTRQERKIRVIERDLGRTPGLGGKYLVLRRANYLRDSLKRENIFSPRKSAGGGECGEAALPGRGCLDEVGSDELASGVNWRRKK